MFRAPLMLLALLVPGAALAQDQGGFNAHGFVMTAQDGDIRDSWTLHRPGAQNGGEWFVGGLLEYASRPLVYVVEQGDRTTKTVALDHVAALNLAGGYTPHERVRFTASVPLYFTSSGFSGGQGPGLGDMRLDAMVLLSAPNSDGIGFGVVPWLDLPLGSTDDFLGRRTMAGGFAAAATYEGARWTATANLGAQIEPRVDIENLTGADSLLAGIAANYLLDEQSSLGLETHLLAPFSRNDRAGTGSPAEALLSYRRTTDAGGYFTTGLAAPLSPGAGAAAFRIFLGGGFGKVGPGAPRDKDLDGITDDLDACPTEPETVNGYVDEDGCPDVLSTLVVNVTHNGEPRPGARLAITGPDVDETETAGDGPWTRDVPPDTMWRVVGTDGACLEGEVKTLVRQERQVEELELKLVPKATVRIHVHDGSDQPVPGAQLLWDSATPECVPDAPALGGDGRAMSDIGPGTHKLVVGAPGHRVVEVPVIATAGDDLPIEVILKPTKLRVEKKRIVILDKVQFEYNKAIIKTESYDLLNEVSEVILRNPQAGRVEVQGHTDSRGSDTYNQDLSQRRADAVRAYLIDRGVDSARLDAVGYGEAVPIADNKTDAGRALNRRVEFHLIDQSEQVIEEKVEDGGAPE